MTGQRITQVAPISAAMAGRRADKLRSARDALKAGRAALALQPVMDARSGRPAFHEGLIRLADGTGRLIPAAEFMPFVEADPLGREVDRIALRLGLAALCEAPGLRLSVNLSALTIGDAGWLRVLDEGIADDPTAAERLVVEITETAAIALPAATRAFLGDLRARGVSLALDDFGAGHTSLRYLREFAFDILKIDGRFVRGLARSADDRVLTAAMVGVAQHFDMLTVAECVETEDDAAACRDLGIDCLQGYLYGAPALPAAWRGAPVQAAG